MAIFESVLLYQNNISLAYAFIHILIILEVNARSLTPLDVCVPSVSLIISSGRWAVEVKGGASTTSRVVTHGYLLPVPVC